MPERFIHIARLEFVGPRNPTGLNRGSNMMPSLPSWLSPWALIALAFLGLSVIGMIMNVSTLSLTLGTLEALGLSRADLSESTLRPDAQYTLESLLASRGFDITRTVQVHELTGGEGFILTQ